MDALQKETDTWIEEDEIDVYAWADELSRRVSRPAPPYKTED